VVDFTCTLTKRPGLPTTKSKLFESPHGRLTGNGRVADLYMNGKVLSCAPLVLEKMQGGKVSFVRDQANGISCTQYIGKTVRIEYRNEGDEKEALGLAEMNKGMSNAVTLAK